MKKLIYMALGFVVAVVTLCHAEEGTVSANDIAVRVILPSEYERIITLKGDEHATLFHLIVRLDGIPAWSDPYATILRESADEEDAIRVNTCRVMNIPLVDEYPLRDGDVVRFTPLQLAK